MDNKTLLSLVRLTHLLGLPVIYMIPSVIMKIVILYYICNDYFYHEKEFNNKILEIPYFLSIAIIVIYTIIISIRINIFNMKVIASILIYIFLIICRFTVNYYYKNDYNKKIYLSNILEIFVHTIQWIYIIYMLNIYIN